MASGTVRLDLAPLQGFGSALFEALGSPPAVASEVAAHLIEADRAGHPSHGVMRFAQYVEWAEAGAFDPAGTAHLAGDTPPVVDGGNGFGIPAMRLLVETGIAQARTSGLAAVALTGTGHTGRLGAFAEQAAEAGMLAILIGGGGREAWRQVVPHGGARAMLPTNPYAIAMPGGQGGPVVLDFATSAGAGGKVYAAAYAGEPVREGLIVDRDGRPTTDPQAYLEGGALLPMAGPKGYGLALMAELICGAMLGPAGHGMNWLGLFVDTARYRAPGPLGAAVEACLAELRACPPAPGFVRVEIPGERERAAAAVTPEIRVPVATWEAILAAAARHGVRSPEGLGR